MRIGSAGAECFLNDPACAWKEAPVEGTEQQRSVYSCQLLHSAAREMLAGSGLFRQIAQTEELQVLTSSPFPPANNERFCKSLLLCMFKFVASLVLVRMRDSTSGQAPMLVLHPSR